MDGLTGGEEVGLDGGEGEGVGGVLKARMGVFGGWSEERYGSGDSGLGRTLLMRTERWASLAAPSIGRT